MANPVYEGDATANASGAQTDFDLTCNKPTGTVEDDLLVAFCGARNAGSGISTVTSSGWTEIVSGDFDNIHGTVLYKVAGGSEPADYDFRFTGDAQSHTACIARISGIDTSDPIDVSGVTESDDTGTPTAPDVTTTVNECLILRFCSIYQSLQSNISPDAGTEEEELESGGLSTHRHLISVVREDQATAGATGTLTWTQSPDRECVTATVAVAPDAGGGGGGNPWNYYEQLGA